jgi:hypothetical protein
MFIVQLRNIETKWDSFDDKAEYLRYLYPYLLQLADELDKDDIYFVGDLPIVH